MYVVIDGVTAGCQAYLQPPRSLSPSLLSLPPITLFYPCLIWQRRWRRAGARVTKGHCSSSNITLILLFPCLVTLPSLLSLSSRLLLSSSLQFCLCFNLPILLCLPHTERQSLQLWWCKTPCHFCYVRCFFFCLNRNSSTLEVFFFCIWIYLKFENTIGNNTKTNPASYTGLNLTLSSV